MALPFLACMIAAAGWYQLPPRVLPSIHAVEGGRPGLVSLNKDGSQDLGPMQVNSRWIPTFAHMARLPEKIVRERLINDPCFNIAAAGAIMRGYLNEARGDLMVAVGWYHSHTPARSVSYQGKVLRKAEGLFARWCHEGTGQTAACSPSAPPSPAPPATGSPHTAPDGTTRAAARMRNGETRISPRPIR